jgi:Flp pilus assembly secretin CpaC
VNGRFLFVLVLAWACVTSVARAEGREVRLLELHVGEQTSLAATGVKSYSEGVEGIVELRLPKEGGQFVLLALKPGNTELLLFMFDGRELAYRISVLPDPTQLQSQPIQVQATDNIRLDFYFVQLSEGYGHQVGVAYPDSFGGAALTGSFDLRAGALGPASIGITDQALPRLDLAQRSGWARVSRQAALIAENGKQAQFHSGGEVNLPIQGALTAEVRSIQFGSDLTIEPHFDKNTGRIELKLTAQVADLSDDGGTGIPGRNVAKLDTIVNLDLGESLVLAGLDAASEARSTRGLPGLSRIPILSALFGTHGKRREYTKNLLLIVPSVVQAVPERERSVLGEMLRAYQQFEGDVPHSALPLSPPGGSTP